MKSLITALLLSVPTLSGQEVEASPEPRLSELVFIDQNTLTGHPSGLGEEGLFLWQSPLFSTKNHPFLFSNLDSIRFSGAPPLQDGTVATISFQNHTDRISDTIEAELLGFDDETVKLKTWYAGDLTLKRSMLRSIDVQNQDPALVTGPGRMDQWLQLDGEDAWLIKNKKIISEGRGTIAREFPDLSDKIHLQFQFQFNYSPYLRIVLCGDGGEDARSYYSLSIQGGNLNFSKYRDRRQNALKTILRGKRHRFKDEGPTQVDIYIDREEGLLHLYLDGIATCSARDETPLKEQDWLHFNTSRSSEQSISNFVIRAWSGNLPEQSLSFDKEEMLSKGEQIELQNGDTVVGEVSEIKEGKLVVKTPYAPVTIPIGNLRSFQISSEELNNIKIWAQDIRAYFHHGGHVTLRLSDFTPTTLSGYSQVFGEATFDLRAFTHIEFNLYEAEFRKRRGQPLY